MVKVAKFVPTVDAPIEIGGRRYTFGAHPAIKTRRKLYVQEGRRARVYRMIEEGTDHGFALKVFRLDFQDEDQAAVATVLKPFAAIEGMTAAARAVITEQSDPDLFNRHRELRYAVVMPWIGAGTLRTWSEVIAELQEQKRALPRSEAQRLAARFLGVMSELERKGAAHTDIAPGNVVCDPSKGVVELIDLEELFAPNAKEPAQKNVGSAGYRHRAVPREGIWSADADRFSAAVLAAEMLASSDASLVANVHEDHFFNDRYIDEDEEPEEVADDDQTRDPPPQSDMHDPSSTTYRAMLAHLRTHWPDFATLFERTWQSAALSAAPTLTALAASLGPTIRKVLVIRAFSDVGIALSSEAVVRGSRISIPMRAVDGVNFVQRSAPHAKVLMALHGAAWLAFLWACFWPGGPLRATRAALIVALGAIVMTTLIGWRRRRYECVIKVKGVAKTVCLEDGPDPRRIARMVASVRLLAGINRGPAP